MHLKERLDWGKLATFVPNKKTPVYNWFYYKEGFARELVLNMIEMFGLKPGDTVLDPFVGSGTTLLACKESGINSVGFDAIPASILASRVKTTDYDREQLKQAVGWLFSERFMPPRGEFPGNLKRFFSKPLRDDILFFRARIRKIEPVAVKDFITLAFIRAVMKGSWVWKDGGVLKVKKHPVAPFRKFFQRILKGMVKECGRVPGKGRAAVEFGDARMLKLRNESVDGIITSPPYLNQIDYTKVYAIEDWLTGKPRPALRSYLGMGEENPVQTYLNDMKRVLEEMFRVCRKGAMVGIVVGDAFVEERPMEIDILLSSMAEKIGFRPKDILILNKRAALRHRTQKVGVLRESLVVLEKQSTQYLPIINF